MALFKILKGNETALPIGHTEGWMYITEDTGKIFVDTKSDIDKESNPGVGGERIQLNSHIAEYLLDHNTEEEYYGLWVGTQAEYDALESISDNLLYYITDDNELTLTGNVFGTITQNDNEIDITLNHLVADSVQVRNNFFIESESGSSTFINLDNNGNGTFLGTVTAADFTSTDIEPDRALISTAERKIDSSSVTSTELGYLSGVTSALQTQLDSKSTATNLINGTGTQSLIQIGTNTVGDPNVASGVNSIALGLGCQATGDYSFASGYGSIASNKYAFAEGQGTQATGIATHSEGAGCYAVGRFSHAEGTETYAGGLASHVEGRGTYAGVAYQHVQGQYNIEDDGNGEVTYAHIVGNGSSEDNRSNAHTLDWSGNAWFAGNVIATKVFGTVWNDYAEYRECDTQEPGRVVCENGDDTLSLACGRMLPGANIISDTFGFAIGETDKAKTPIAVSGRVLAYTFEDRNTYKSGEPVCSGPNGTVSKMSREEIINYPECIVGYVSAIPQYEIWGENNISVNNRIWIKVR